MGIAGVGEWVGWKVGGKIIVDFTCSLSQIIYEIDLSVWKNFAILLIFAKIGVFRLPSATFFLEVYHFNRYNRINVVTIVKGMNRFNKFREQVLLVDKYNSLSFFHWELL